MTIRVYQSNLPGAWPIERQERLMGTIPDGALVYQDILAPKDRQGHRRERMTTLEALLSPTAFKIDEVTIVPVLGVLDWTDKGLLERIALLVARGGVLQVLMPPMTIGPESNVGDLYRAVQAFHLTRERQPKSLERGLAGASASKKARWAASELKLSPIRERWVSGNQSEHPTASLLAEAGVARNTVIAHIGHRKGLKK